ncbi:hypothetical protein HanIR_Chr11g0531061 [Helianthus annuus]|nr:hypothetical protein HanIR_Chr11g0531061 [Helianthus annuus]
MKTHISKPCYEWITKNSNGFRTIYTKYTGFTKQVCIFETCIIFMSRDGSS